MDETNKENIEPIIHDKGSLPQIEKETIVIKEKHTMFLTIILVLLLLATTGIAYLMYTTANTPSYDELIQEITEMLLDSHIDSTSLDTYSIQGINGDTIIFNPNSGDAYYPETGIRISIDDYAKKREGLIFTSTSTIPASTDLYVSAQVKASEGSILYSIDLSFTEPKTALSEKEIDQLVDNLGDSSNNNYLYLNFYDKDTFLLFSKKIPITGGTTQVNSNGYGGGLTLEGSLIEDSVLIGLISNFNISWNISILD